MKTETKSWDEFELSNGSQKATIKDVPDVARQFCVLLKETVGETKLREVVDANRAYGPDADVCASHEVCDANVVMENAFRSLGFKTGFGQPFLALWEKAWNVAKLADFDPKKIMGKAGTKEEEAYG